MSFFLKLESAHLCCLYLPQANSQCGMKEKVRTEKKIREFIIIFFPKKIFKS